MEGRLFLFSIWWGVYGLGLRKVFKNERWAQASWVPIVFNSLFWGTAAAMIEMLMAGFFEMGDPRDASPTSIYAALAGLVFGGVMGFIKANSDEKKEALLKDNLEWADTGFSAILLASVVMFFVVQAFKIPTGSMRMTFVEGDHLFVNKFIYGIPIPLTDKKLIHFRDVKTKDVVIFRFPTDDRSNQHYGKDFIKRVVATEGQKVEIKDKKVFVDDIPLVEPYKQHVDRRILPRASYYTTEAFQRNWEEGEYMGSDVRDNFGPIVVPSGHVMVMGDNRDQSYDSRFWGPLPVSEIKGKAWLLYWPISRFKLVE